MKKVNKKKLLILSSIVFLIVSIVGITSLIAYAQNTDVRRIQEMSAMDSAVNVNISFDKSNYEYIEGDTISITPKIEGLIEDGEHPDEVSYQWDKVTVNGPLPSDWIVEDVTGSTTKTLTKTAQLEDEGIYRLWLNIKRYDEAKSEKVDLKFCSRGIEIIVLPGINIKLLGENQEEVRDLELEQGKTYKLKADLYRQADTEEIPPEQIKSLTWTSSNSNIVEVTDDGYLTAKKYSEESVKITATVTDINDKTSSATASVTVKKVLVGSIQINGEDEENISEINLEVEEHATLTAIVSPQNASLPTVTWKIKEGSPSDIATIDKDTGEIIGKKIGDTIVVATADETQKECTVNVVETPVKEIVDGLENTNISLFENRDGSSEKEHTLTIHPKVLPENATHKEITWESSDTKVATVVENDDGTVTFTAGQYGESSNKCTITATANNGVKRIYNITILNYFIKVDSVEVAPEGSTSTPIVLTVGETKEFDFKIKPENATYKDEEWYATSNDDNDSSTDVISVDESGVVTALKEGTAYVRVSVECQDPNCPKHVGKSYIKVIPAPDIDVESVEIEQGSEVSLRKNSTTTLTARVTPENATNKTVIWESLNPKIAKVDKTTGEVTGIAPGDATIRATAGRESGTCKVTVTPINVESLNISDVELTVKDNLKVGEKQLSVTYYPEDADNKGVNWTSSDPDTVEVKEDGTIVPKKVGSATVTAKLKADENIYVGCLVKVIPSKIPVVLYTVDQHSNFISGLTLRLTGTDDEGNEIGPKELTTNGKFDFGELPDGSYTVHTILPNAKTVSNASELDIIDYVEVCNFQIIDANLVLEDTSDPENKSADSLVLVNIVDYPDESGEDKKKATVGIGEDFTKDGKTILEQYEEYDVVEVTSIIDELSDTNISLVENKSFTIHPEVLPKNASNKELTWKSTGDNIARVEQKDDGSVTFIAGNYVENKNTCTITGTAHNGIKREYHITVVQEAIEVQDVIITTVDVDGKEEPVIEPVELHVGETKDLNFKVVPEGATYMEKKDVWSFEPAEESPSNVISIDGSGLIEAKEIGEAQVTVTVWCQNDNCLGHTKTISVKVIPVPVEKVEIELEEVDGQKHLYLYEHDSRTLTAKVTPENATDKTITWESSNPEIVSVDENGRIEALAKGEATITARAGDKTDTCQVTVIEFEEPYNQNEPPKTENDSASPDTSDVPLFNYILIMASSFLVIMFIIFKKNKKLKRKK